MSSPLAGFALSALSVRWRRGLFRRVAFRRARYRVVVSSIFCLSSPSMRRISASASARLRRPSSWICMTSSKVLMRDSLVCLSVSMSTMPRSDSRYLDRGGLEHVGVFCAAARWSCW